VYRIGNDNPFVLNKLRVRYDKSLPPAAPNGKVHTYRLYSKRKRNPFLVRRDSERFEANRCGWQSEHCMESSEDAAFREELNSGIVANQISFRRQETDVVHYYLFVAPLKVSK